MVYKGLIVRKKKKKVDILFTVVFVDDIFVMDHLQFSVYVL